MIKPELARRFIEEFTRYTEYNINIMNEKGIIIASADKERVGDFHEVAWRMLRGSEDMAVTAGQTGYPGVKPGMNLVLTVDGKREGVVGLTGDPEEIKLVAPLTKIAIEAMLKYEKRQDETRRRRDQKNYFANLLIHGKEADLAELRSAAKQLPYSEHLVRIPLLCRIEEGKAELFLEKVKQSLGHGREDISLVLDGSHVLIFKEIKGKGTAEYKAEVREYLSAAAAWLSEEGQEGNFYVGSLQSSFSQYSHGYQHCKWLESQGVLDSISFFYDYTGEYVRSLVPANELQWMFSVYEKELDSDFKKMLVEVAGALIGANYNLVKAAGGLFMHKNTLLYRYQKIREVLNINPMESSAERSFLEGFYIYLKGKN